MQKFFTVLIFQLLVLTSCQHSNNEKNEVRYQEKSKETQTFFPVTDFLLGQLRELDSLPVTPLKTVKINKNKIDSVWLKREDIRDFATPFLLPVIDSVSLSPYFSMKSFIDQTINSITLTYDPIKQLPDSINLRTWDVYIDPQKGTVQRIYIVKENEKDGGNVTTQLTWNVNNYCSIRTITQIPGKEPSIKEERMTWNFDH